MKVDTGGQPWWLMPYLVVTFIVCAVSWIRWRGRVVKTLDQGETIGVFRGLRRGDSLCRAGLTAPPAPAAARSAAPRC